jgi:hypothetical protein
MRTATPARPLPPSTAWKKFDPQTVAKANGNVDHVQSAGANLVDAGSMMAEWAGGPAIMGLAAQGVAVLFAPAALAYGAGVAVFDGLGYLFGGANERGELRTKWREIFGLDAETRAARAERNAELKAKYDDPLDRLMAPADLKADPKGAPHGGDVFVGMVASFWWLPARAVKGVADAGVHLAVGGVKAVRDGVTALFR